MVDLRECGEVAPRGGRVRGASERLEGGKL